MGKVLVEHPQCHVRRGKSMFFFQRWELPWLLFLLDKVGSRFAEVESLLSLGTVLRQRPCRQKRSMANPAKTVQEAGADQPGGEMGHCRPHDGAPGGLETGHPVALICLKMPVHAGPPWTCSCWKLGLSTCGVDALPFIHQNTWV